MIAKWPESDERIDLIAHNGATGEHYDTYTVGETVYRINQNGHYAMYLHKSGEWRESASVTNSELRLADDVHNYQK